MKAVSFNVNGIRARMHQIESLIETESPDVIGLQEIKVIDDLFPKADIEVLGYHCEFFGQKGHYGVALLSKKPPVEVCKGFPGDDEDAQRRFIYAKYESESGNPFWVMNGYFPQGESRDHPIKFPAKERFYKDLHQLLQDQFSPNDPILLMGDMNVAHTDFDIGIGEQNAKRWLRTGKTSFLPEEREWLNRVLDWGFKDGFRIQRPECNKWLSWFDYRSKGFDDDPRRGLRIDYVFSTEPLLSQLKATSISYDIRGMEKPSDHAPVIAEFDY